MNPCTNVWLTTSEITPQAGSALTAAEERRLPGTPYDESFLSTYISYYWSNGQVVCRLMSSDDVRYYVLQASPECLTFITTGGTGELSYNTRIYLFDVILPTAIGGGAGFLLGRNQTTGVKIGASIAGAIAGFFAKRIILGRVDPPGVY